MQLEAAIGIDDHGAQLPDQELPTVAAEPSLAVKRAATVDPNNQYERDDEWKKEQAQEEGRKYIDAPLRNEKRNREVIPRALG
jgi:hypothetical protein